ncbi:hypothetical protein [Acinetobacter ursingii]|uniref:hypothetical protein n=1 Tax=Acinetobacter ursingii TaxID=108980 RepID=UPI00124EF6A6|nr:hypothetical protein [Acinetobacter ursingii]
MSLSKSNLKAQKSLGNDSLTATVDKLIEAITSQNQVIVAQNQQLIAIVDQNSQLMNQVQSLTDLLAEQLEPSDEKPSRNLDD